MKAITNKVVNSAIFGWMFAGSVFGVVAGYAYWIALNIHTTGSELIKIFL